MNLDATLNSEQLTELWLPEQEWLQAKNSRHPTVIRVHRAISWLAEAEVALLEDTQVVLRWIGLNSLFGRWDEAERKPCGDRKSLHCFLDQVWTLDVQSGGKKLQAVVEGLEPLVLKILDHQWLQNVFWKAPSVDRAQRRTQNWRDAPLQYAEGKHRLVFERTLDYVYFLRCQLVHGAATANSSMNRDSVVWCNRFLSHAMSGILEVIIQHGAGLDWGELCYPPVEG